MHSALESCITECQINGLLPICVFFASMKRESSLLCKLVFYSSHYDDDVRDTTLTHFCLETVLARESPDFVAFTGDMVTGYNWDGKPGWFKKQWLKFSERMTRLRLPYAYVLGNHDVVGTSWTPQFNEHIHVKFFRC